jgi:homocysteine S-methyltransferase
LACAAEDVVEDALVDIDVAAQHGARQFVLVAEGNCADFPAGSRPAAVRRFRPAQRRKGSVRTGEVLRQFLPIAQQSGLGFVLDTATWRASLDWGRLIGLDADRLKAINVAAVELVAALRNTWETPSTPIVLNGVIGPRGDGYKAGRMEAAEAEEYHAFQVEIFAGTSADMVSAVTMNTVNEAVGIARAAKTAKMPCVISFTVETDGRLADGTALRAAIEATEEATGATPAYHMVNCAHPTHVEQALKPWSLTSRGFGSSRPSDGKPYVTLVFLLGNAIGAASDLLQLLPVHYPDVTPRGLDGVSAFQDMNFVGNT